MIFKLLTLYFNPLVPEGRNIYCITKILFLKRRDQEKISYERRIYESVDDESLFLSYISKFDGENVSGTNGIIMLPKMFPSEKQLKHHLMKFLNNHDSSRFDTRKIILMILNIILLNLN